MSLSSPGSRRPSKRREETHQDLKSMAFITFSVGVASLLFLPYARDIWAAYLALVGAVLVLLCAIRLYQVFGFLDAAWHPQYWRRGIGSGWIATYLWLLVGLALIMAAAKLSVKLRPFFLGLGEIF